MNPIKIKIENFQSIESLEFDINGFTCITGKTNIGKSAIIRAITSALLNNSVIGMVRHGASHSTVTIKYNDDDIKWEKGEKGINRYTINGKLYDKVGAKQLEAIKDIGFKSVSLGSEEIFPWYASQFFPIFLLDRPGTQVTDFICEVSRLNVLQDAVVISNRNRKQLSDKIKRNEEALKQSQAKYEALDSVKDVSNLVSDLRDQKASIDSYEDKILKAKALQENIRTLTSQINTLQSASATVPDAPERSAVDHVSVLSKHKTGLDSAASRIILLKSISSVTIPSVPSEFAKASGVLKLSGVPRLADSIKIMQSALVHKIPDEMKEELRKYAHGLKTSELMSEVRELEGIPKIPDLSIDEVKGLEDGHEIHKLIMQLVNTCREFIDQIKETDADIVNVDKEISKIPLCPTCAKPSHHQHKEN